MVNSDINFSFPIGNEKEDYKARKQFITNFYAGWIAKNTVKRVFNKKFKRGA